MIPSEIKWTGRVFEQKLPKCDLELFSTNHDDKWVLGLKRKGGSNLAFLLELDHLEAFGTGLKQCIDSALNPDAHPGADMMANIIAHELNTNYSESGGIAIYSYWSKRPEVEFVFYIDESERTGFSFTCKLKQAMDLYNLFATEYNSRNHSA